MSDANLASGSNAGLDSEEARDLFYRYGVPFLLSSCLSLLYLSQKRLSFRVSRIYYAVLQWKRLSSLHSLTLLRLLYLLSVALFVVLPPGLIIIWGYEAAQSLEPSAVGLTVIFLGLATLLFVYAMGNLLRSGFFVWNSTVYQLALAGICIVIQQVQMVCWNEPFSFFGLSIIAIAVHEAIIAVILYQLCAPSRYLIPSIATQLEQAYSSGTSTVFGSFAAAVSNRCKPLFCIPPTSAPTPQQAARTTRNRTLALYGVATLWLVCYAVLVQNLSETTPDIGWITVVAVVVVDIALYLSIRDYPHVPLPVVVLTSMLSKTALVSFGEEYWFMGHTVLFLVLMTILMLVLVAHLLPRLRSSEYARGTAMPGPSADTQLSPEIALLYQQLQAALTSSSHQDGGLRSSLRYLFRHTITIAPGILLVAFSADIAIVAYVRPDGVPLPKVSMLENEHEQYIFGLGAIMLSFIIPTAYATHRELSRNGYKSSSRVFALMTLCVTTSLLSGVILFRMSGSWIILSVAAFLPLALYCALQAFVRWVNNDYEYFVLDPVNDNNQGAMTRWTHFTYHSKAFFTGKSPRANYVMVGYTAMAYISLIGHAVLINYMDDTSKTYVGWAITASMVIVFTSIVPVLKWFNTYTVDSFFCVSTAIFFTALIGSGFLFWQRVLSGEINPSALGFLFCVVLYPVVLIVICATIQWRDDGWKIWTTSPILDTDGTVLEHKRVLNRKVIIPYIFSYFMLLAFSGVVAYVYSPWTIGVGIGIGITVLIGASTLFQYGIKRRFHFSRPARVMIGLVCLLVALLGVVIGVQEDEEAAFWGYSMAWGTGFLILCIISAQRTKWDQGDHIYSESVFPVYHYDRSSRQFLPRNSGTVLMYSAAMSLLIWGLAASIFLAPVQVGITAVSVSLLVLTLLTLSLMNRTHYRIHALGPFIDQDVFTNAQHEAVKAQLGRNHHKLREHERDTDFLSSDGSDSSSTRTSHTSSNSEATSTEMSDLSSDSTDLSTTDPTESAESSDSYSSRQSEYSASGSSDDDNLVMSLTNHWDTLHKLNQGIRSLYRKGSAAESRVSCAHIEELDQALGLHIESYTMFKARFAFEIISLASHKEALDLHSFNDMLGYHGMEHIDIKQFRSFPEQARQELDKLRRRWRRAQASAAKSEADRVADLIRQDKDANDRRQEILLSLKGKTQKDTIAIIPDTPAVGPSGDPVPSASRKSLRMTRIEDSLRDHGVSDAVIQEQMARESLLQEVRILEDQIFGHSKDDDTFSDEDFEPDQSALGDLKGKSWERASALFPNIKVGHDSAVVSDVRQGSLGDCWFLSALTVLASHPGRLKDLFISTTRKKGAYTVVFNIQGLWRAVVIDDYLPVTTRGKIAFAKCEKRDQARILWVALLEKAYAKVYGNYDNIQGGMVHMALVDLTGGISMIINMTKTSTKADVASGKLWADLLSFCRSGYLLGAGTHAGSDTEVIDGIVKGHAYAILDVRECDKDRVIKLRNPWGRTTTADVSEWQGEYSDNWPGWTKRARHILNYPAEEADSNDGEFWMPFAVFTQRFRNLYICKTFDAKHGWSKNVIHGEWVGTSAGGCRNNESCARNPQYHLVVTKPTRIVLQLAQSDSRGDSEKSKLTTIGLEVFSNMGEPVTQQTSQRRMVAKPNPNYINRREVSLEQEFAPQTHPYTIFVSTFSSGIEGPFSLTCCSDSPVSLSKIPQPS